MDINERAGMSMDEKLSMIFKQLDKLSEIDKKLNQFNNRLDKIEKKSTRD